MRLSLAVRLGLTALRRAHARVVLYVIGLMAAHAIEAWLGWPVTVPLGAVLLSFAVSVAVGIAFGFYPAARASRIEPIDALRFE